MSLYTPVFPPLHESNNSQKGSPENSSVAPLGKQQNYVKYLRDLHLFLSTQGDVLSPPSRPNSPMFDHHAQKVKDKIHDVFNPTGGETSSTKWTRASQTLKLGCVRGRHWSLSQANLCAPEQDAIWILPDEESEWIEWEKKEANRRLKGKTNASQQIGSAVPAAPGSQKPSHVSFAGPSQSPNAARPRRPPGVSPRTLRAAKEKVKKWQATMASEVLHDTTYGSLPTPTREVVEQAEGKRQTAKPLRSRTLDFAVAKLPARSSVGKRRKGFVSHPAIRGDPAAVPLLKSRSPKPSNASKVPQDVAPVDAAKTPPVKCDMPRISNVSGTPYLPPSFPAHLDTSTPLSNSKILVRAKPPPILPALLSTPPPSTPAQPPDDRQLVPAEPHVANVSSSPHIITAQPGKRSRASSRPVDGIGAPVTPPAKRPRILPQNESLSISKHSKPMSSHGALDTEPCTRDDTQDSSSGAGPSHRNPTDTLEMALDVSLTPAKTDQPTTGVNVQDLPEKISSPPKSVRSYFSAPDSDPADSPVNANLLLESPVSPMLSYAENPSIFLPQITSTQVRKGSPTAGRANNGIFGVGYSSQFDVERHVDRVSELLEKDVDFDGWLRDARTLEISQD